MRRSASPSKVKGGVAPTRYLGRDDSINVLKAAFKPPRGRLENDASQPHSSLPTPPKPPSCSSSGKVEPIRHGQAFPQREVRVKKIDELEDEIAAIEAVVGERLVKHNTERKSQGLDEQNPDEIVAQYITLLTQYNKVKDSTQLVFDKIAEKEQLPAGDIHARYGVAENDV